MTPSEVREHCDLDGEGRRLLERAHRELDLSARGWDRCLRLARTIADLAGERAISAKHVGEAVSLRRRPKP
jgi:magnesium chelatase family protein